jgi:hypothetical protein
MIQGEKKPKLTIDAILSKISEFDIFRFYMPNKNWKLNQATKSPFHKDDNPSFIIGTKYGTIHFMDFTDTSKRGGCFDFVQKLYNLPSLFHVLQLIDRDFSLGISSGVVGDYKRIVSEYKQPEDLGRRYSLVQVKVRKFTNEELAYWNMYHQDITDLRREKIYSIDKVYLNKQLFSLKDTELRFGYFYEGNWKIYRPFVSPKLKWIPNNVPITQMDGKEDIIGADVAMIQKSKKDYMVMKKLITSCAVQNEGIACFSEENVEYINSNVKRKILSFDSDPPGVKNSKLITETFGWDYCNVPRNYLSDGIKDWADLAKDYGMNTIEKILKKKHLL